MEPEEGLDKVIEAIRVCSYYKKVYFTKKDNISSYFKDPEVPVVQWSFGPELIFARLNNFIKRLTTIEVKQIVFNWTVIGVVRRELT